MPPLQWLPPVPALMYVFALLVSVRLEAGKFGLERANPEDIPSIWTVLVKQGYMLTPLVALVGFLVYGFTPAKAAVLCIGATLLLSPWKEETRISLLDILEVCVVTVRNVMPIVAAVAIAGILIGVLTLTGLALQISSMILSWGGDSMLAVLLLTMIASFILGMACRHLRPICYWPFWLPRSGKVRAANSCGPHVHLLLRIVVCDHAACCCCGLCRSLDCRVGAE